LTIILLALLSLLGTCKEVLPCTISIPPSMRSATLASPALNAFVSQAVEGHSNWWWCFLKRCFLSFWGTHLQQTKFLYACGFCCIHHPSILRDSSASKYSCIHPSIHPSMQLIHLSYHLNIHLFAHLSIKPTRSSNPIHPLIYRSIQPSFQLFHPSSASIFPSMHSSNHSSFHLFIHPFIHLSFHSPILPSIYPSDLLVIEHILPSIRPSSHLFIYPSIQLVHPIKSSWDNTSILPSIHTSFHPSINPSICPYIHYSVHLPIHPFTHLSKVRPTAPPRRLAISILCINKWTFPVTVTIRTVVLRKEVGGRQTSARSQMYIKDTRWFISCKAVSGCRPHPTTPLVTITILFSNGFPNLLSSAFVYSSARAMRTVRLRQLRAALAHHHHMVTTVVAIM